MEREGRRGVDGRELEGIGGRDWDVRDGGIGGGVFRYDGKDV